MNELPWPDEWLTNEEAAAKSKKIYAFILRSGYFEGDIMLDVYVAGLVKILNNLNDAELFGKMFLEAHRFGNVEPKNRGNRRSKDISAMICYTRQLASLLWSNYPEASKGQIEKYVCAILAKTSTRRVLFHSDNTIKKWLKPQILGSVSKYRRSK